MSEKDPITEWIRRVQNGDERAIEKLWERYYRDLVHQAERRIRGRLNGGIADGEDLAQSAFKSFILAAREGRYPRIADRHDLWRLLLCITNRKSVDLLRHEGRRKRQEVAGDPWYWISRVVARTPSPEFMATMAEETARLLGILGDPRLQAIALAKLDGRTNEEIAREENCSLRSIERQLHLIRRKWSGELESQT